MAKKKKKYKVRTKNSWHFTVFCFFLRLFKHKPKLINTTGEPLSEKAIYVMNHSGASGPFTFELHFPVMASPWGAYPMNGTYKERWNYLYHIFYQQKLHWGKCRSFIVATLFAVISKYIYNSIGFISTYPDSRLMTTMKNSIEVLNADRSVVIFPEDSSQGYLDNPVMLFNGFIALAELYYKKTGTDLPVYNVYYSKKKKCFIVDKPLFVHQLTEEGKTADDISAIFLQNMHRLYEQYIAEKPTNEETTKAEN